MEFILLQHNGEIIKDHKLIEVPVSYEGYEHYPKPSEADEWIKLFENLKNNFTDEDIEKINNKNWKKEYNMAG